MDPMRPFGLGPDIQKPEEQSWRQGHEEHGPDKGPLPIEKGTMQRFQEVLDDPRNQWIGMTPFGMGMGAAVRTGKAFMPMLGRTLAESSQAVPIENMMKFREFDRTATKRGAANIEKLEHTLADTPGFNESLVMQYFQGAKKAILGEGNHRLQAAKNLGFGEVPVRVIRNETGPFRNFGDQLTSGVNVSGIQPNKFGYVPGNLKPGEIGIPGARDISKLRRRLLVGKGSPEEDDVAMWRQQMDDWLRDG